MIRKWIDNIINGYGGLKHFERCEIAEPNIDRDEAVAGWVLRCLANPECEGSREVLDAIIQRRCDLIAALDAGKDGEG